VFLLCFVKSRYTIPTKRPVNDATISEAQIPIGPRKEPIKAKSSISPMPSPFLDVINLNIVAIKKREKYPTKAPIKLSKKEISKKLKYAKMTQKEKSHKVKH